MSPELIAAAAPLFVLVGVAILIGGLKKAELLPSPDTLLKGFAGVGILFICQILGVFDVMRHFLP